MSSPRKLGGSGSASSTVKGKGYALSHFMAFLDSKNIEIDLKDPLPRDLKKVESKLCSIPLWQQFAGYLCDVAVTKYTEESMMLGTVKQYLSGAKETVQALYKDNEIWYGHDSAYPVQGVVPWYSKIRNALDDEVTHRCIRAGISVQNKSYTIGSVRNISVTEKSKSSECSTKHTYSS